MERQKREKIEKEKETKGWEEEKQGERQQKREKGVQALCKKIVNLRNRCHTWGSNRERKTERKRDNDNKMDR